MDGIGTDGIAHRRHESALGWWESIIRPPAAALAPYVRPYHGFREDLAAAPVRLETPSEIVPLIVTFSEGFRITGPAMPHGGEQHRTFIAGLADAYVHVGASGPAEGVQIDVTPLGAYRLLGMPMHLLANHTIELGDVIGDRAADAFAGRLREARDWPARFAIIDSVLARAMADGPEPEAGVVYTWRRLRETHGRIAISSLADALSWNRRRLIDGCREQLGLPPKTIARVMRFQRAASLVAARPDAPLSAIAVAAGYYDQSHFSRDFRVFTGATPGAYAAGLMPGGGVIAHAP